VCRVNKVDYKACVQSGRAILWNCELTYVLALLVNLWYSSVSVCFIHDILGCTVYRVNLVLEFTCRIILKCLGCLNGSRKL
jgi:hypothetical protein